MNTANYEAPSREVFVKEYLPLISEFVIFDKECLTFKDGVFDVNNDGQCDYRYYEKYQTPKIVFDYKAPTTSYSADNKRREEILQLAIDRKLVIDEHFEFNGLSLINKPDHTYIDNSKTLVLTKIVNKQPISILIYIGFTSNNNFYPMKPLYLPINYKVNRYFVCFDINDTLYKRVINHQIADGIYYNTKDFKTIEVYRGGACQLSISTKTDESYINYNVFLYINGEISNTIGVREETIYHSWYTNGVHSLREIFDHKHESHCSIECNGEYRNGKYYDYNAKTDITFNMTYVNKYLSGPFEINRPRSNSIVKGTFRSEAKLENISDFPDLLLSNRLYVGEYIDISPDNVTKKCYFDSDGYHSGVQYYQTCDRGIAEDLFRKRGNGDFKCYDNLTELTTYYFNRVSYSRVQYEALVEKQVKAIEAGTILPLVLVKIIMDY